MRKKFTLQLRFFEVEPLNLSSELRGELEISKKGSTSYEIASRPGETINISHDPKEGASSRLIHNGLDGESQGQLELFDNQSDELRVVHSLAEGWGSFKVEASRSEKPGRGGVERG